MKKNLLLILFSLQGFLFFGCKHDNLTYPMRNATAEIMMDTACGRKMNSKDNIVYSIFIPSQFTPDNDGKDDYFSAHGLLGGIYTTYFHIIIFRRSYNLVFESNDAAFKWDGDVCEQGEYMYIVETIDACKNMKHKYKGSVLLMR